MAYKTRQLVALTEFRHGKLLKPGASFAATETDAEYLVRSKRAADAPKGTDVASPSEKPAVGAKTPLAAPATKKALPSVAQNSPAQPVQPVEAQPKAEAHSMGLGNVTTTGDWLGGELASTSPPTAKTDEARMEEEVQGTMRRGRRLPLSPSSSGK